MPTIVRWIFLFLLLIPARAAEVSAGERKDGVTVRLSPIKIERHTFDTRRPPPDLPPLTPPEVAACVFNITCRVEGLVQGRTSSARSSAPVITQLTFFVDLVVTLWIPTDSTPKINRHEEAHRQISEHYYARADAMARRLGRRLIGTAVDASARDERAMGKALEKVQDRLVNEFMHQIADRCLFAQKRFDQLTAHGTNTMAEAVAVSRAIADERATSDNGIPRTTAPSRSGSALSQRPLPNAQKR